MATGPNPKHHPKTDAKKSAKNSPQSIAEELQEREQRRLDRVLRNRKAAKNSREKKRKYTQFLEESILKLDDYFKKLRESYLLLIQYSAVKKDHVISFDNYNILMSEIRSRIGQNESNHERTAQGNWLYPQVQEPNVPAATLNIVPEGVASGISGSSSTHAVSSISGLNNQVSSANLKPPSPILHATASESSQKNFNIESIDDKLYYSYLSMLSLNMQWEKVLTQVDLEAKIKPGSALQSGAGGVESEFRNKLVSLNLFENGMPGYEKDTPASSSSSRNTDSEKDRLHYEYLEKKKVE